MFSCQLEGRRTFTAIPLMELCMELELELEFQHGLQTNMTSCESAETSDSEEVLRRKVWRWQAEL